jgi:hypothetical protein
LRSIGGIEKLGAANSESVSTSAGSTGPPRPVGPSELRVRAARYGLLAAAVGSAALVWHRFLRPMPVGKHMSTQLVESKLIQREHDQSEHNHSDRQEFSLRNEPPLKKIATHQYVQPAVSTERRINPTRVLEY